MWGQKSPYLKRRIGWQISEMNTKLSRALVTGASGMLGSYIDFGIKTSHKDLDIVDYKSVAAAFAKYKPEMVLHLAAETDMDRCERDPGHAYLVNTLGTYNVALAAKACGIKMIYVSTAGVFDGKKETPYLSTDTPNPQNHYARSKHLGELAVKSLLDDYLIVRVGWMMGGGAPKDKKFVGKIIGQLLANPSKGIKAVNDQFGSPTFAGDLIEVIKDLIEKDKRGIIHVAGKDTASRFDVAKFVSEYLIPGSKISGVPMSYFNLDASRPKNEAIEASNNLMRPWKISLKNYLENEWSDYFKNISKFYKKREDCRGCSGKNLTLILDMGSMPPANSFIKASELSGEKKFPLTVLFCNDCKLLQVPDIVDPQILFGQYDYLTSASAPLAVHFRKMGETILNKFSLSKDDLVVEIGGNDGVLLEVLKDKCRTLNIEPAKNVAEISAKKGIDTINEFFGTPLAEKIITRYGEAKVVVANNVMAHIDDIQGIFKSVRSVIGDNGVFVFEVHWVGNLLGKGGFDQIYHEHLCYYSLTALQYLLEKGGLKVFDVELFPVHGESMRVYAARNRDELVGVKEMLKMERGIKLDDVNTFLDFKKKVGESRNQLVEMLMEIKKRGKTVVCYGAPAKGNTLLNYCDINNELIDYITDTTSFKQGLLAPGSHIPVCAPEKLQKTKPDYLLLLAWNYADSIIAKESEFKERGGKFIVPVPAPKII